MVCSHGLLCAGMAEVLQAAEFSGWLQQLGDANEVARIVGGDKRTQQRDIKPAQKIAETL